MEVLKSYGPQFEAEMHVKYKNILGMFKTIVILKKVNVPFLKKKKKFKSIYLEKTICVHENRDYRKLS